MWKVFSMRQVWHVYLDRWLYELIIQSWDTIVIVTTCTYLIVLIANGRKYDLAVVLCKRLEHNSCFNSNNITLQIHADIQVLAVVSHVYMYVYMYAQKKSALPWCLQGRDNPLSWKMETLCGQYESWSYRDTHHQWVWASLPWHRHTWHGML